LAFNYNLCVRVHRHLISVTNSSQSSGNWIHWQNITNHTTACKQIQSSYRQYVSLYHHHHHHQPINVSTAGAQAFLMDYTLGERSIIHHAGPVRIVSCLKANDAHWASSLKLERVLTTANSTEGNGLTCLPKHGAAQDKKFLVTHLLTDQNFRNRTPSALIDS
jgi:hypothetical protein